MSRQSTITALLLGTLLLSASCGKETAGNGSPSGGEPGAPAEGAPALLTVVLGGDVEPVTRSTFATDAKESRVNDLQMYVFNGSKLDGYGHVTGSLSGGVSCTSGKRDVYVLVNAPEVTGDSISTKEQLFSLVQVLNGRSENGQYVNDGADNFVMYGKATGCDVAVSATVVDVTVRRFASRIIIEKVTRQMADASLAAVPASRWCITRMYLADVRCNAVTDSSVVGPSKQWLNAPFSDGGRMTTDLPLICDAPVVYIADGQSYQTQHRFYAYPNDAVKVTQSPISGKPTRLVVEVLIDGSYYTYPLEIRGTDGMGANQSFRISNLTISHLGNPSNGDDVVDEGEDDAVTPVTPDYTVSVSEWGVVPLSSEGQEPGTVVI